MGAQLDFSKGAFADGFANEVMSNALGLVVSLLATLIPWFGVMSIFLSGIIFVFGVFMVWGVISKQVLLLLVIYRDITGRLVRLHETV